MLMQTVVVGGIRVPRFRGLATVVLAAIGTLIALTQCAPAGPGALPAEVSVTEALSKRTGGAYMLDVRQPDEWAEYHIPGSNLIPLDKLPARIGELPRDREIVVVCRSGNRSAAGRDILKQAGFQRVTSMSGGLSQWRASGYPVATGNN